MVKHRLRWYIIEKSLYCSCKCYIFKYNKSISTKYNTEDWLLFHFTNALITYLNSLADQETSIATHKQCIDTLSDIIDI